MRVKIGKSENEISDKKLTRAVEDFCEIKMQIDALNEKLKEHKDVIVCFARDALCENEATTISFIGEENGVKVSFGWDVKVSDEEMLRNLLADKFDLLVKTECIYKPEKKLKELALNDDGLKECLEIKEKAPAVSML